MVFPETSNAWTCKTAEDGSATESEISLISSQFLMKSSIFMKNWDEFFDLFSYQSLKDELRLYSQN